MSRSFKALQSLRTASVFKDLLTNAASRKGVSATKSSVKALSGLQVLSVRDLLSFRVLELFCLVLFFKWRVEE